MSPASKVREQHVVVAAHGHCFDGLASAAMFTHLRQRISPDKRFRFTYKSCGYGPNMQNVPQKWLRGDENAIVDFRYVATPRLTWYFDHHVTAFASEAVARAALAGRDRYFYDPAYSSCTKLIADVGRERYGVDFEPFTDLVRWADRIDSASFASAEEAIDRRPAVMQLATVVEQHGDAPLLEELVSALLTRPLQDVASDEAVLQRFEPIRAAQEATEERIARALERHGPVVYVDLHDAPLKASGKFVAYALAPTATYSVSLIRMKQHYKVSVGYNPWSGHERNHDIAALCKEHGGGGHPVVGAVSVALDRLDDARRIARDIIGKLGG